MVAVPATTLPPWGSWVAEMAAVCAQAGAQLAAKPANAQAHACDQRSGGTPCSWAMGGAFLIMGRALKKAG